VGNETAGNTIGKIEFYTADNDGPRVGAYIKTTAEETFGRLNHLHFAVSRSTNATATEVMRVTADGLTFNGDTAAANALDDYEVGSWTPTIRGTSGNTYASFTTSDCKYIKIGKSVTITGYLLNIVWSDITNGGSVMMEGLPYATSADNYSSVSFGYNNTNLTGGYVETNGVVYFVIGTSERNQINNDITGNKFMFSVTYILD
jgi:hypothetical protein